MAAGGKWLRWSFAALMVGLLLAVIGGAWWIGWSESFPRWALARAAQASGGVLEAGEVEGSLVDGATLGKLVVHSGETRVEASGVHLRWRPQWLLAGTLRLTELRAERIDVTLGPGGDGPPPSLPEQLGLPLKIGVDGIEVAELHVHADGAEVPVVRDLAATLRFDGEAWRLPRLGLRVDGWGALQGQLRLAAEPPYALSANLRAEPAIDGYPGLPPLLLDADGPLDELPLVLRMPAPTSRAAADAASADTVGAADWLRIETTLRPFDPAQVDSVFARLDGFEAAAIGLPGPRTRLSGTLALAVDDKAATPAADASIVELPWSGRIELRNDLAGTVDAELVPLRSLATGVDWRDGRLRLDGIELLLDGGGTVGGEASVDTGVRQTLFGVDLPAIEARLALRGIDLAALSPAATPTQLGGSVELQHDRIDFALDDASRGEITAKGKARLDGELLRVETLALRTPGGSIEAAGHARWQEPWQGELSGRFADLAPARLATIAGIALPAQLESLRALGGSWSVSGEIAPALTLQTSVRIDKGHYMDMPLHVDWRGHVAPDRLDAIALSASLGEFAASASGAAGRAGDRLHFELRVPKLQAIEPTLAGALTASGDIGLPGLDAKALEGAQLAMRVEGRALEVAGQSVEQATLTVDGTLAAHRLELAIAGEPASASLQASGAVEMPDGEGAAHGWRWRGSVERFRSGKPLTITLAAPMPLTIGAAGIEASAAVFESDGGRLELARVTLLEGRFEVSGQARRLPISRWAERFGLLVGAAATVDEVLLGGRWELAGSSIDDLDGTASLTLTTGAKLNGNGSADLRFDDGRLSGRLDLAVPSLAFANRIVGPEWGLDGRLRIAGDLAGTLRQPALVGTLEGRELVFRQHRLGWRLDDGVLEARFDGERVQVDRLRLRSGDGTATLSGSMGLSDMAGRFRLLAERLTVPIGPGQRFVVSGDTEITSSASELKWTGKIGFDEGLIELRGGEAPRLPDDVVVVDTSAPEPASSGPGQRAAGSGAPAAPAAPAAESKFVMTADLEADLGKNLRIRGHGVDARLEGSLRLQGAVPGALRAHGTVRVREGVYQAYGQRLEITRGRVIFNGPIDNPVLDITAMRRGGLVEAGVAVTGTALSPRVRLVSTPEVPDAQKLSWLVLGVGMEEARSGAQMAALTAAAATLFGGEGGGLTGGLAQSLGLDVLAIRNASNSPFGADFGANFPVQAGSSTTSTLGTAQDVVAIGKRLGSRVMVTYEQGLRGVWSLLRLQYDITRRLSVRAQTGTDTAIDLLYFFTFD